MGDQTAPRPPVTEPDLEAGGPQRRSLGMTPWEDPWRKQRRACPGRTTPCPPHPTLPGGLLLPTQH